jgi:excisionase family DNA binding protein
MQKLMSIEEAANALGLKPVTIRQWAGMRRIARVKLGRRVLIPADAVERLIEANLTYSQPCRSARDEHSRLLPNRA